MSTAVRRWLRRDRLPVTVPVLVGLLAVLAGLVMAFVVPQISSEDWTKEAKAAQAVANDFVVTFNTYEAAELDDYRERVEGLVTEQMNTDFLAALAESEPTLQAAQLVFGGVRVASVGVTELDDDTATVVVVFTLTVSSPTAQEPSVFGSRALVELEHVDGEWKVAEYNEIQPVAAQAADAAGKAP